MQRLWMGSREEKCQNNGKLRETLQTKEDTIGKIGVTEKVCHGSNALFGENVGKSRVVEV